MHLTEQNGADRSHIVAAATAAAATTKQQMRSFRSTETAGDALRPSLTPVIVGYVDLWTLATCRKQEP